jgi:hypothetical protein
MTAVKFKSCKIAIAMAGATLVIGAAGLAACAPAVTSQTQVAIEEAEPNQAAAAALRLSFIVNFRPSHNLGQAQALQSVGRHDEARQLVAATLRDDTALRGLCFERFTLGGAEIVLNVCAPDSWEDPLVTQRRWLEQLGATPGVAYVERNLVAHTAEAAEARRS